MQDGQGDLYIRTNKECLKVREKVLLGVLIQDSDRVEEYILVVISTVIAHYTLLQDKNYK